MNLLSLVGTSLGSPSHSRNRLSKKLAVCVNGILILQLGVKWVADRFSELGDDHLLRFVDDEERSAEGRRRQGE